MGSLFHLAVFRGEENLDDIKLRQNPYCKLKERFGREALFRWMYCNDYSVHYMQFAKKVIL